MNAKRIYSELKEKGYDVQLTNLFSYEIDKDKRFNVVIVNGILDKEIISIVNEYGCMLVADTYVDVSGDEPVYAVKHSVYPKDMKSFDWVCE